MTRRSSCGGAECRLMLRRCGCRADLTLYGTGAFGWPAGPAHPHGVRGPPVLRALKEVITSPCAHPREYVASRTLEESPDLNVEIISDDPVGKVRELKAEDGELGLYLCGGSAVAGALIDEIDELVIRTYPVVRGSGVRRGALRPRRSYPEGMGIDEHVCPVCGQPVATVVRRHKTLGAWVPVWSPGPCRNHECAAYVEEAVEAEAAAAEKPRAAARRTHGSHGTPGGHGAHGGADTRVEETVATTEAAETPETPDVRTEEKA